MKKFGLTALALAAWWLWIPLFIGIIWVITHLFMSGLGVAHESWNLYWQSNILNHGAVLWIYIWVGAVGSAVIAFAMGAMDNDSGAPEYVVGGLAVVLAILSFIPIVNLNWDQDKDVARFYSSATTFYTPSLTQSPASLQYLLRNTTHEPNGCTTNTQSDVGNCVKVGTMPEAGFEARSSSAEGALLAMKRTSGATQNVSLLSDTLVYLQGKNAWSAIRDGSGNSAHTEGVVEWAGTGVPSECYFGGDDQFNKAINGAHTNSLSNVMAKQFPTLYWTLSDSYGFCQNNRPVLVFLVRQQHKYLSQTLDVPAGAIYVTGSANGDPTFTYHANLTDAPGPSYPFSVAQSQINANKWAGGRSYQSHGLFGYAADSLSEQPFLLKSNKDGHTYIVTPMTLNSSNSQLFVAYGMVRADTVQAGKLNPLSIYVLATNDIRRINIDSLEASARDYLSQQVPGFFSSGGKLVDYTPTVGDVWRVFGEINGRVVYRLDISASNVLQPNLVSLENFTGSGSSSKAPSNAICGQPISGLSQAQIQQCVKLFAAQLGGAVTTS